MSIVVQGLSKFFAEHLVVNKFSLEIQDGELFVLLGGSGSGKSTILRLIAGLAVPDEGRIELNGRDVTHLPTQKRGVGVVFQHYALFKHMSVLENIEFGLRIRGISAIARRQRGEELLDLVGLSGLGNRFPGHLSGGQRQRVAVARALAYDPSVLLLDEPFGALDVQVRSQLRESFRELQRRLKMTTILVTHDQEEAFELGDRIGVLERGKLLEIGTPESLYHRPKTEGVATFLGSGNVLVGRLRSNRIELGEVSLPLPNDALRHEEGAPVRVLFRPEAVVMAKDAELLPAGVAPIGVGILRETFFAGSQMRYRFDLPELHGARQLAPAVRYGQRFPTIEVRTSLPPEELTPGTHCALGVVQWHVLAPTGIKLLAIIQQAHDNQEVTQLGGILASAGKGAISLLGVCEERDRPVLWRSLEELYQEIGKFSGARIEARLRIGQISHEVVAEAQEGFYEVAIIPRTLMASGDLLRKLVDRLVGEIKVPVMLVGASHRRFAKILICTAGGAPGRGDVRLGGRLARQTGAFVSLLSVERSGQTEQQLQRIQQHLDDAQAMLYSIGINSERSCRKGPIVESILAAAQEGDFDLIVVGASGVVFGKVPEEISKRASCPVLIVPTTATL